MHERSFRKTGMNTPSRREYQLEQGQRNEQEYKREGMKSNPYDGDVEQSEERNRYVMR